MFNIFGYGCGLRLRAITLGDLAVGIDQEFCEVPFDTLGAHNPLGLPFQPAVQWVCVRAVDLDFCKNWKCRAEPGSTKFYDLLFAARLLTTKLIAGKRQNIESLVVVLGLKRFKALVLGREAAFGSGIDDQ